MKLNPEARESLKEASRAFELGEAELAVSRAIRGEDVRGEALHQVLQVLGRMSGLNR